MKNQLFIYPIVCLFSFLWGCGSNKTATETLIDTSRKTANSKLIQYKYVSNWDNRFNETTYSDSASIILSRNESDYHEFGFYANTYDAEHLFDGVNYREIRHKEEIIVQHDAQQIREDSSYFANKIIFFASPIELSSPKNFTIVFDTIIDNKDFYVYKEEERAIKDNARRLQTDRLYYLETKANLVRQIQQINIVDGDTLQIIDYHFSAFKFDKAPFQFTDVEQSASLKYREIGIDDLDNERHLKQITAGEKLDRKFYKDINDQNVSLYGDARTQNLILFSFIGCGGCEYAMREMKKKAYQIKDGINFYFSSPNDKKKPLKSYLAKKEFPFGAFSQESNMNEDFSIYSFPTFVLIDSKGVVTKVLSGYDEEVEAILF